MGGNGCWLMHLELGGTACEACMMYMLSIQLLHLMSCTPGWVFLGCSL